jgi:hypothetical protein
MIANRQEHPPRRRSSSRLWLGIVFLVAFLERLLTIFLYQPAPFSDTPSYRRLAGTVLQGFANYDGTRTPGYPVFLALVGSDQTVWYVQLFLGLLTTLLLFYIGWKLIGKPWFGGLIALAHTLNLGQLFFESDLLTESLTTFLVVLSIAGVLYWFLNPGKRSIWLAFSLGLVSTLALFVRPLFIYLPFLTLLVLWLAPRPKLQTAEPNNQATVIEKRSPLHLAHFPWFSSFIFLVPVLVLLGGWVSFIHARFGDWSLTTMTGYHLVQHTGNFFEYVPDEYATLRDIYIKYRDAHIAEYGTQTNTIWEAIPEMSQATGYSFYGLSRVLARISIQLILRHPLLYLQSVATGWWMFWRTAVYWSADALRFSWMAGVIQIAILAERAILFLTNLFFIIASLAFSINGSLAAIRHVPSRRILHFKDQVGLVFAWFLLATIWIASILQTLLDHGDNPRFLVPLQSLVVLWVAIFIYQIALNQRSFAKQSAKA